MTINKYTVLKDTSEQKGWNFTPSQYCEGTIEENLYTGDYTLRGFEKDFIIERKGCVSEFAQNIFQVRFQKELERMEAFKHPYLVLEFTLEDIMNYPHNCGLPPHVIKKIKTTPWTIQKKLIEFTLKYKTQIIFAGRYGKDFASSLFKRIVENAQ